MLFIPAIDIIDGKCVRLFQGDYAQKKSYDLEPLATARNFFSMGVERLHIVDLDGAQNGKPMNHEVVLKIARRFPDKIVEIGGGIRTREDVRFYIEGGASRVILGSGAISDRGMLPEMIEEYGRKIVLGLDIRDGRISVHGWQTDSGVEFFSFLDELVVNKIFPEIIFTDIKTDGTLKGPALALVREVCTRYPMIPFIASGGISTIDDVHAICRFGFKNLIGMISGKAIYEKKIELPEALAACNLK
jgi:phosphoribosylformimino-5-aminoimidazole carboxamide ribotide isomerase